MSAEDIKPSVFTTVTITVPGGKDGMKTLTASPNQLVEGLPSDVQAYLRSKPNDIHRILAGESIRVITSNGASEVTFLVSKSRVEVLDSRRDG